MKTNEPKYKIIYTDIIIEKCPEKMEICHDLLEKVNFSFIDILDLNKRIFGDSQKNRSINAKFRSYNQFDILKILDYQKKNHLNNSQLACHFKLSRNTISNWKKKFV